MPVTIPNKAWLLTNDGIAAEAAARASGVPLVFTKVRVAAMTDEAYAAYLPNAAQHAMFGEIKWAGAPDHVWVDPDHTNQVRVAATFNPWTRDYLNRPVDDTHSAVGGGFYIREVGLFVGSGENEKLWAIAKWPQAWVDIARPSDITLAYKFGAVYTLADDTAATTIFAHEGAGLCSYDYVDTNFLDKRTGGTVTGPLTVTGTLRTNGEVQAHTLNCSGAAQMDGDICQIEIADAQDIPEGYNTGNILKSTYVDGTFQTNQRATFHAGLKSEGDISQVDYYGGAYHYHVIVQREIESVPAGNNILGPTYVIGGLNVTGTAECTIAPPYHFMSTLKADGVTTLGDQINQTGNAAGTNQLKASKVNGAFEATGATTLGGTLDVAGEINTTLGANFGGHVTAGGLLKAGSTEFASVDVKKDNAGTLLRVGGITNEGAVEGYSANIVNMVTAAYGSFSGWVKTDSLVFGDNGPEVKPATATTANTNPGVNDRLGTVRVVIVNGTSAEIWFKHGVGTNDWRRIDL